MEDERVSKFTQAILREAAERRQQLEQDTDGYIKTEMSRAEDEILLESYHLIQNKIAYIRSDIGREQSQRQLSEKRAFFMARERIVAEVFEAAQERLIQFTETPDYPRFLAETLKKCAAALGGGALTVYLAERDLAHAELLCAAAPTITLVPDPTITLGGLRVKKNGTPTMIDESLDTKLRAEREWFSGHSGLTLLQD